MSPTALTLRYLRRSGYLAEIVERWIPGANIRKDLFSVGDIMAATVDLPPLLVQCTSLSNVSARLAKARACPGLAVWLKTGHARFWIIGWAKVGGAWCPKVIELSGADMDAAVLSRPPRRGRSRKHEPADLFAGMTDA